MVISSSSIALRCVGYALHLHGVLSRVAVGDGVGGEDEVVGQVVGELERFGTAPVLLVIAEVGDVGVVHDD